MAWNTAYIIIRLDQNGVANIVHQADAIKDARYWLQYIALPGDAIFATSAHPKFTTAANPVYQAHLLSRGKIEYSEMNWKKMVKKEGAEIAFNAPAAA